MEEKKDPRLWAIAQQRASFKSNLVAYIIVISFLWILWSFTGSHHGGGLPWPVWPMLGWGVGLAFHYSAAYINPKKDMAEREYEKLKNQNK
jgi:2TM domain